MNQQFAYQVYPLCSLTHVSKQDCDLEKHKNISCVKRITLSKLPPEKKAICNMNGKMFQLTYWLSILQGGFHSDLFFVRLVKMQMHDAADFNDGFWRLLHAVSGLDHLFRVRSVEVGARVRHNAVTGIRKGKIRCIVSDN